MSCFQFCDTVVTILSDCCDAVVLGLGRCGQANADEGGAGWLKTPHLADIICGQLLKGWVVGWISRWVGEV